MVKVKKNRLLLGFRYLPKSVISINYRLHIPVENINLIFFSLKYHMEIKVGEMIGIKVKERVRENDKVYKVVE